ncbi:MAG: hypothetical protein II978_06950 [Clostridia bacterium]|nr:hypothetical protein [Clostridia bacterium]
MKKLLSVLVSMLVLVSSMGVFTASAEVTIDKTINLGKDVVYTLPAETLAADGETAIAVTWKNASGEEVTAVDTSVVGSKLYTGTTAENATLTYRVNTGEYVEVLVDDLEGHETLADGTQVLGTLNGGTFSMPNYIEGGYAADNKKGANRIVTEADGNKVLSIGGTGNTGWTIVWTLKEAAVGGLKISMRMKEAAYDLNKNGNKSFIAAALRLDGAEPNINLNRTYYVAAHTDEETGEEVPAGWLPNPNFTAPSTNAEKNPGNITYALKNVEFNIDENNIMSTDWYTVDWVMGNDTMDMYSNGELMAGQVPAPYSLANDNTVGKIVLADRDCAFAETYFDDIEISKLVHYNGDIPTEITVNVPETAVGTAAFAANYPLTMSDGSVKYAKATFVPESATGGTTTGTLEGFDGTVTVNYTVAAVSDETINVEVGKTVTLADGSTVTPTAMGRIKKTVSGPTGIINYTINAGRFDLRHSDEMETHETKPADDTYGVGITPGIVKDGFKLTTTMNPLTSADNGSAVTATKDGSKVLHYTSDTTKSINGNLTWNVIDSFEGNFRVSVDLKVENASGIAGVKPWIRLYDLNGSQITNGIGPRIVPNGNEKILAIRGNADGGAVVNQVYIARTTKDCGYNVNWTRNDGATADSADTKNSSDWFTLRIDGNSDKKTYDVYVNDILVQADVAFLKDTAEGNLGKITMAFRDAPDADVYIDNLKVYQFNCFTGELPESLDVLVGQGAAAPQETEVALTLSNGGVWKPKATVNVDSSKLGVYSTTATVEGFDEEIPATVKVCNYDVDTIAYTNGAEFATGASVGATIASAAFTNKSGIAGGKALFAWYNAAGSLKVVKAIDIPTIAKDETKTVDVGLKLPTVSEDVVNGKLKVFIFNSMDELDPVDVVTEVAYKAPTAPTVHIAGASTFETYDDYYFPKYGVGQALENYFVDGVEVNNKAKSGHTTQMFIDNGYWDSIMTKIKPGDYAIVHFAHNDQVKCAPTGEAFGENCVYTKNLQKYIDDVRAKGANIILLTGIARRTEGIAGKAYYLFDNKGNEPHNHMTQLETVCAENDVPFIDMSALSSAYLQKLAEDEGEDATRRLYMQDISSEAGVYSDNISYYQTNPIWAGSRYNTDVDAKYLANSNVQNDYTHFTIYGANVYADMLTDAIAEKYPTIELTQFIDVDAEPKAYPGF